MYSGERTVVVDRKEVIGKAVSRIMAGDVICGAIAIWHRSSVSGGYACDISTEIKKYLDVNPKGTIDELDSYLLSMFPDLGNHVFYKVVKN